MTAAPAPPHVVVIGGGISGLAAAHALRGRARVTVIEASGRLGGKLHTTPVADLMVDEGAEQFLLRAPEAAQLAAAVGVAELMVHPATSTASIWTRGALRPMPPRTLMGIPSSPLSLRGVLTAPELTRLRLDRVLPGGVPEDDVAVGSFVARRLGRAVVDRLVDPLLGGVYAGRADKLSLHATIPQLTPGPGPLMAKVAGLMPAPADDAPAPAPVFGALSGGMSRLVEATAAASGADLLLGRTVRRLERAGAGWRVVHGPTTDEQVLDAAGVVVAVPAAAAARLLRDAAPAAAADLAAIDYASMVIVTLAFRRDAFPATTGSGYLVPAVEGRAVKAVTFASAKWPHLDGDTMVVRCSLGRAGEVEVLQRDDAELVRLALGELERVVGVRGGGIASRVTRWGGGLPQYAVGHLDRVRRIRAAVAGVPGLGVCGAAYDGVGVPACIRTGRLAAEEALSRSGSA